MKKSGKRLSALLIAGCAVFATAGVSTATAAVPAAKAKVSVVNRTLLLPPQGTGSGLGAVTAPCPSNRTLIGGGSRFDPSIAAGIPDIELVSSGPAGGAWNTVMDNNQGTAQPVVGDAICLKNKLTVKGGEGGTVRPKVKRVTEPLALPGQATNFGLGEIDVPCPKGYTVASGGLRVIEGTPGTTSNEVTAFESGPKGNGWHARYDNDSVAPANAEASALCLKNKSKVKAGESGKARAKLTEVEQTLAVPDQGTNAGVAQFDVSCPSKTKLVGGGARYPDGTPLIGPDSELFESGPNGNKWHVRYNNNLVTAQPVLISAICLRQSLKVK